MTKSNEKKVVRVNPLTVFEKPPKKVLKKARKGFRRWANETLSFKQGKENFKTKAEFGIRVTALPLKPIKNPKRIFEIHKDGFFRSHHFVQVNQKQIEISVSDYTQMPTPCLRGVEYLSNRDPVTISLRILNEGLIEILWRKPPLKPKNEEKKPVKVFETKLLSLFVSALGEIEKFRKFNKIENSKFVLEMEIFTPNNNFCICPSLMGNTLVEKIRIFDHWVSPLYEIGPASSFDLNLEQFHRDVYDSIGFPHKPQIFISKKNPPGPKM